MTKGGLMAPGTLLPCWAVVPFEEMVVPEVIDAWIRHPVISVEQEWQSAASWLHERVVENLWAPQAAVDELQAKRGRCFRFYLYGERGLLVVWVGPMLVDRDGTPSARKYWGEY